MARGAKYAINFRFVGNAQTQKATRASGNAARNARGRFTKLEDWARVIVEDVALNTADRSFKKAKASLEQSVAAAVEAEIGQMAKMIGRFLIQPKTAFGPKGEIKAADLTLSKQGRSLWGSGVDAIRGYELSSSDAHWGSRSNRYMKWKNQKGYPSDWWKITGQLRQALSNEALYRDLGPVQVSFSKTANSVDGKVKQTSSGLRGTKSVSYTVGQLNVQVMGRITPDMLPAIMDASNRGAGGVGHATPTGSRFIPSLFSSLDNKTRGKLLRFGETGYRPVVEPFLAYYLTRAIPNAIFNRTEKIVLDRDIGSARQRTAGRGSEAGMGFGIGN